MAWWASASTNAFLTNDRDSYKLLIQKASFVLIFIHNIINILLFIYDNAYILNSATEIFIKMIVLLIYYLFHDGEHHVGNDYTIS